MSDGLMPMYNNFNELAAAQSDGITEMSAFNKGVEHQVAVSNFYGDRVQPAYKGFEQVLVRFFSNEIIAKFDDRPFDNPASWEWVKTDPANIGMDIGITVKGDEQNESRKIVMEASFNTQTGVLSSGGEIIGTLHENPVDAVIRAINSGDKRILEAAEKVVHDYVNANPEKFGGNNG